MPQEMSLPPTLYWRQIDFQPVYYYNGPPLSRSFGDFDSTAHFSNNYYTIASNATLYDVMLSHNGIVISCYTPSSVPMTFVFKVIGMNTHKLILVICSYTDILFMSLYYHACTCTQEQRTLHQQLISVQVKTCLYC